MTRGAVVGCGEFTEHLTHPVIVILRGIPTVDSKRTEFMEGGHLTGFSGHGGQIEDRRLDGDVARKLGDATSQVVAETGPELTE